VESPRGALHSVKAIWRHLCRTAFLSSDGKRVVHNGDVQLSRIDAWGESFDSKALTIIVNVDEWILARGTSW
jgi:hypothetical protein